MPRSRDEDVARGRATGVATRRNFKELPMNIRLAAACLGALVTLPSLAAPVTYNVDPNHTHPSFAADHFGGLSTWRGMFQTSSGTIVMDKEAGTGTVKITVDTASIDFGMPKLAEHAKTADMFDVAKYPTATYEGKLAKFKAGAPTEVEGTLTLHGVTKPVTLKINKFLCKPNPMMKKDECGADASATINREDFGIGYGKAYGFDMSVLLQIQVEAIKAD
jgi:polyisoprenoid-binding protein YceI